MSPHRFISVYMLIITVVTGSIAAFMGATGLIAGMALYGFMASLFGSTSWLFWREGNV